jgi:uncharacterized protein (TIGR00369 family)
MQVDLDTLQGFFRAAPFMVDLGVEAIGVEAGRITTELALQPRHLQHTDVVHAGVMAAMADHSMGAAAQTMAPEGHWILTAEFKTNLLRGARGDKLVCEAWVLKPGRQIMFTEAEVYAVAANGERQLVVKASGTMAVTKA